MRLYDEYGLSKPKTLGMTTFLDRWFRAPKLQKYSGSYEFDLEIFVNFTPQQKRLVKVLWVYDGQRNYATVDKVVYPNTSDDIWYDLPSSTCSRISRYIQENFVSKWMKEVGIVHPYDNKVLWNPYSGKW